MLMKDRRVRFPCHIWEGLSNAASPSERLRDDHDEDDEERDRRDLVQHPPPSRRHPVLPPGEIFAPVAEPVVEPGEERHHRELHVDPAFGGPADDAWRQGERHAEDPGSDHCRIHDPAQEPAFHGLEDPVEIRSRRAVLGMIDEEPGQVEHASHPAHHGEDVQHLYPRVEADQQIRQGLGPSGRASSDPPSTLARQREAEPPSLLSRKKS